MTCSACDAFTVNRLTGAFRLDCLECAARHLAQSPDFAESAKNGNITQDYRKLLDWSFGSDWPAGHANVKRYAALIKGAPL